jgi:hypothetical protein
MAGRRGPSRRTKRATSSSTISETSNGARDSRKSATARAVALPGFQRIDAYTLVSTKTLGRWVPILLVEHLLPDLPTDGDNVLFAQVVAIRFRRP